MNKKTPGSPTCSGILCSTRTYVTVLLFVLFVMSGCASQQPNDSDEVSNKRKSAESNTSLGLEYMNRGQNEVALGKLKKAAKADPSYAPAFTVMAVLYERLGETSLAGKNYKKAYAADPNDGDVNNNYGVYLCKTGESAKAMTHFSKTLDDPFYSTPAVSLTNAGSCALQTGDLVAADDYLRRALKIEPDFPDALITMARLNYLERNYLNARAFLQRYEAVEDHRAESLLIAYKVELASRDPRSANKYKLILESSFPGSEQAAEVRRLSGQ
jgi:type IV pilus assembly protein PilF